MLVPMPFVVSQGESPGAGFLAPGTVLVRCSGCGAAAALPSRESSQTPVCATCGAGVGAAAPASPANVSRQREA